MSPELGPLHLANFVLLVAVALAVGAGVALALVFGRERRLRTQNGELERANAELKRLVRHDELTGLYNRRAADAQLSAEIARHLRSGRPMAVVFADIDHFKRVNDTHGHAAGDHVLAEVAATIFATCRRTDFVARYGGEEFLVILPDTNAAGAVAAAEKIRAAVRQADFSAVGRVTLSIGVATRAPNEAEATMRRIDILQDALLARADVALYEAKSRGRDRVIQKDVDEVVPPSSSRDMLAQRRAG